MGVITQEEVDILMEKIRREELSITEIKPQWIEEIRDDQKREEIKKKFESVNFLYVNPLEKLLDYFSARNNKFSPKHQLENLSINERIDLMRKLLFKEGCNNETIINHVPHTEREVDVIMAAKDAGFVDERAIDNETRVSSAMKFLEVANLDEVKHSR